MFDQQDGWVAPFLVFALCLALVAAAGFAVWWYVIEPLLRRRRRR